MATVIKVLDREHEPIRYYHEVDPVRWDRMVRAARPNPAGAALGHPATPDEGADFFSPMNRGATPEQVAASERLAGEIGFTSEGSVAHSPSGPCPKCDWPYCRVPAVRPEPAARCAACGLGTPTSNFEGGGCFDYPLHADGSCPDNADAAGGNGVEEQPLCPTCAEKVAKFISHLRATHGGRR